MRVAVLGHKKASAEGIAHLIGLLRTVVSKDAFIRFVNYEATKEYIETCKPDACVLYDRNDDYTELIELAMANVGGVCIRMFEFLEEAEINDYKIANYLSTFSFYIGDIPIDVNKLIAFEKHHSQLQSVSLRDKDIQKHA